MPWLSSSANWCSVLSFVRGDAERRHSDPIRAPEERHCGREHDILARRHQLYRRARSSNPERWTAQLARGIPSGSWSSIPSDHPSLSLHESRDNYLATDRGNNPLCPD
jgi:hypothetical protein